MTFAYFTLMACYSFVYRYPSFPLIAVTLTLDVFFIIYELIQMTFSLDYNLDRKVFETSWLEYFSDFWNIIDIVNETLIAVLLYFIFIGMDSSEAPLDASTSETLVDEEPAYNKEFIQNIYQISLAFAWYRGLAHFRAFATTRYLFAMIIECLIDMRAFLILLIYAICAFDFMFLNFDSTLNPVEGFAFSFLIAVGDWDTGAFNLGQWITFVVATVVVLIVMMNLLISIVGDTFERVQMNQAVQDASEMINLLIEIDTIFFWKRDTTKMARILACKPFSGSQSGGSWEGRMRKFFERIETVQHQVNKIAKQQHEQFN